MDIGLAARRALPCTAAKTLFSSGEAIFNARMTSTKNMAAGPSFSRASFPSFEHSALPLRAQQRCLTQVTWPLIFLAFGGIFWVGAMILGGFSLGRSVPNIGERIHYVIAVVIVVSVLPAVISIYRSRNKFGAANDQGRVTAPRPEGK